MWDANPRKTMKLVRSNLDNEDQGRFVSSSSQSSAPLCLLESDLHSFSSQDWTANGQTSYIVENQDAKNKYGENRGYRIMPCELPLSLSLPSSMIGSTDFVYLLLPPTQLEEQAPRG